jgi:hypothetical protein
LYSFLGIFVIFVVDSFARIGKYVRWKQLKCRHDNTIKYKVKHCSTLAKYEHPNVYDCTLQTWRLLLG